MMSCNLIFWSVVMPILTLVSEIWILSDKDHEIIQNFRRYSRRRVQRFPQTQQTQNICAMSTKYLTQYLWNITENVY